MLLTKAHSRKKGVFEQTHVNSLLGRMHCSRLGHNPIGMSGRQLGKRSLEGKAETWERKSLAWRCQEVGDTAQSLERKMMTDYKS